MRCTFHLTAASITCITWCSFLKDVHESSLVVAGHNIRDLLTLQAKPLCNHSPCITAYQCFMTQGTFVLAIESRDERETRAGNMDPRLDPRIRRICSAEHLSVLRESSLTYRPSVSDWRSSPVVLIISSFRLPLHSRICCLTARRCVTACTHSLILTACRCPHHHLLLMGRKFVLTPRP